MSGTAASIVRLAQPADEAGIMALCRLHFDENGPHEVEWQDEHVRAHVQEAILPNRNAPVTAQAVCGVIGPHHDVQAGIYFTLERPYFWSDRMVLRQVWETVRPEFRKTGHGRALLEFSKVLATCLERTLFAESRSQHRLEPKERSYARAFGRERAGGLFIFNPPPGA
jgi:GNAT superfamily N-acetyltransferase